MAIECTEEKRFTVEQVEALFKSVGWESAQWPERLFKALQHSDTVISAWDGGHLVGLVRVLDDTPGLLEASVMTSPVVNQCLVIGDKKPFVAALVTLDLADANNWLESQGAKPEPDLASLAKNAIVHAEVERAVNAANEGVSRAESIRKFEILPDEFTEANGMLTPSLKTRRAQIVEHYRELIDDVIYVPLKK